MIMHKKCFKNVKKVDIPSRRALAIQMDHDGQCTILINVYMPCDTYDVHKVNEVFNDIMEEIEGVIATGQANNIILCGDCNTSFERNNAQSKCLSRFVARNDLELCWKHDDARISDTYNHTTLGHHSCIDHFIVSKNVFNKIKCMYVTSNGINMSKHDYLLLSLENFRSSTTAHKVPICKNEVKKSGMA